MFPDHLILLTTTDNSELVKSPDRLTNYSARFDEFDRIEVLTLDNRSDVTFDNRSDVTVEARYYTEDRHFLISYDTITHNFCIAEYPDRLWESGEFGTPCDIAYPPDLYHEAIYVRIEDGCEDADFNPTPRIWEAEDRSRGIYSSPRDLASGRSGSIRALAVPSFGGWVMEDIADPYDC